MVDTSSNSTEGLDSVSANEIRHSRQETSERLHYLDNLRAIAMLLGIFLHAGLAYAEPSREIWFSLVILVTMFFSLLSYVVLVRYTPIG
jgi:peptidoglycan/LPS O-acetylase OafA/YrhL